MTAGGNHMAIAGALRAYRARDTGPVLTALTAAGADAHLDQGESGQGWGTALYTGPGTHRLLLTRQWRGRVTQQWLTWVALNSSTAGATSTDAMITRCHKRTDGAGYGGMAVLNLFGLISTDPTGLHRHPDPVGAGNDALLRIFCQDGPVICAWGNGGIYLGRAAKVTALLRATGAALYCLGVTAAGQPRHPGRLGYDQPIRPWTPR